MAFVDTGLRKRWVGGQGDLVMKNFWLNVRYAGGLLKKDLGFTFVALLALTLGIGANTAIFSVVDGALLAPLPYPNADQLVMVWSKFNGQRNGVSAGDFLKGNARIPCSKTSLPGAEIPSAYPCQTIIVM